MTTQEAKKEMEEKGGQAEGEEEGGEDFQASGAGFCSSSPAPTCFCHENFMFPQIVLTLESYHTICSTICLRIGPDLDGYRATR